MQSCKVKYLKVVLEPFQACLYVVTDVKKALALCDELFGGDPTDHAEVDTMTGWVCRDEERPFCLVMCLDPAHLDDELVWHEALHVTTWLHHHAGANLHVMYNDEVLTYYQGYVVREVQKALDYQFELENNHEY